MSGIYFPPFSVVHILCKPYAQLHHKLAVAQLIMKPPYSEYIFVIPIALCYID